MEETLGNLNQSTIRSPNESCQQSYYKKSPVPDCNTLAYRKVNEVPFEENLSKTQSAAFNEYSKSRQYLGKPTYDIGENCLIYKVHIVANNPTKNKQTRLRNELISA